MEITINSYEHDYRRFLDIYVDGSLKASFHDGEHEDNTLSRNFNDCYKIIDLMEMAYNAETIIIKHVSDPNYE